MFSSCHLCQKEPFVHCGCWPSINKIVKQSYISETVLQESVTSKF